MAKKLNEQIIIKKTKINPTSFFFEINPFFLKGLSIKKYEDIEKNIINEFEKQKK